jgi:hypothetical protein
MSDIVPKDKKELVASNYPQVHSETDVLNPSFVNSNSVRMSEDQFDQELLNSDSGSEGENVKKNV